MAVFKRMHVSLAKHNDEKGVNMTSRKCDYHTDTQADRQTNIGRSCSYVPLCFAGKAIKWHKVAPSVYCIQRRLFSPSDPKATY